MTLLSNANDDLDALLAESEERNRQLIEQKTAEIENYKRQIAAYKNDGRTAEERLVCFNDYIMNDSRVERVILPLRDG